MCIGMADKKLFKWEDFSANTYRRQLNDIGGILLFPDAVEIIVINA